MKRKPTAMLQLKRLCLLVLLLLCSSISQAQNYSRVDSLVAQYPKNFTEPAALAERIGQDFSDPYERTRAIFNWIAHNIAYSYDAPHVPSFIYPDKEEHLREKKKYQQKLAKLIMEKRIAVCEGYSRLFNELCDLLAIDCIVVSGDAKNSVDDIYRPWRSNHAWNIITIEGKQHLIDATWGAGHMFEGRYYVQDTDYHYFFTDPSLFILNHYPEDPKHTLLERPISKKEYAKIPLIYSEGVTNNMLLSPLNGVLRMGKSDCKFVFQMSEPLDYLSYDVGSENYRDAQLEMKGEELHVTIDLKGKRGRELVFFINGKGTAAFKIRK